MTTIYGRTVSSGVVDKVGQNVGIGLGDRRFQLPRSGGAFAKRTGVTPLHLIDFRGKGPDLPALVGSNTLNYSSGSPTYNQPTPYADGREIRFDPTGGASLMSGGDFLEPGATADWWLLLEGYFPASASGYRTIWAKGSSPGWNLSRHVSVGFSLNISDDGANSQQCLLGNIAAQRFILGAFVSQTNDVEGIVARSHDTFQSNSADISAVTGDIRNASNCVNNAATPLGQTQSFMAGGHDAFTLGEFEQLVRDVA